MFLRARALAFLVAVDGITWQRLVFRLGVCTEFRGVTGGLVRKEGSIEDLIMLKNANFLSPANFDSNILKTRLRRETFEFYILVINDY